MKHPIFLKIVKAVHKVSPWRDNTQTYSYRRGFDHHHTLQSQGVHSQEVPGTGCAARMDRTDRNFSAQV